MASVTCRLSARQRDQLRTSTLVSSTGLPLSFYLNVHPHDREHNHILHCDQSRRGVIFYNVTFSLQHPANIGISLSISCHTYAVYYTMCIAFHSRRNIMGRCWSTVCLSVLLIYITTLNFNCVLSKQMMMMMSIHVADPRIESQGPNILRPTTYVQL